MNKVKKEKMSSAAVLGLGVSGEAAAELLVSKGIKTTILDDQDNSDIRARAQLLMGKGVEVGLGLNQRLPENLDCLVVSPGIPGTHPLIGQALETGVPVKGEIELASQFIQLPLSAVTGTNGKTTTVEILARILNAGGKNANPAGNFGFPLSRIALDPSDLEEVALELSSFQIERLESFSLSVAAITNFAFDHLDRHPDPEVYFRAKARLFGHLGLDGIAVIPSSLLKPLRGYIPSGVRVITWGGEKDDLKVIEGGVWTSLNDVSGIVVPSSSIDLFGPHNLENIMVAVAIAICRGIDPLAIAPALAGFKGVAHRLERLGSISGVEVINDSKATNPHAVAAALVSFPQKVVWIAGGSEKSADFSPLEEIVSRQVSHAVFLGETASRLERCFQDRVNTERANDLEEALDLALTLAQGEGVVVLSPGCASFDMFKNYKDRGESFRALVETKINQQGSPAGEKEKL